MKNCIVAITLLGLASVAQADPQLTSWFTANSGKYARIYQSTANETAGTTSTTWTRGSGTQSNPVYSDVNEINYSTNWVYIRTSGLASHVMGPWYLDANKTQNFPNFPSNTATVYRIPRTPVIPTTKTLTGLGATGRMVNGVSMFDSRDAFSYVNASATDATPQNGLTGDGIWNRDGYHNEGVTFDPALAHQAGNNYHYHAQPIGLRYQLGDHVDYNATTNRYTESASAPTAHSPILAWAADGLPVYGPYGYSSPMNATSGVRRMVSGFTKRDGTNGTTAITVRQVLPLWAQRVQNRTTLTASQYGPAVNATYALGHYIEDFDYRGDLGQTLGTDFDLNEQNVRFCVTPEFPSGTWAYFTTINADGTPQYPYTTGRAYYGDPTGGGTTAAVMNADTPLTQQFIGGANKALAIGTPNVTGTTVTLTWSAVEGGTYSVDASPNQSTWTSKATGIVSTGISANSSYTALGTSGTEYGRVNRTALATYDSNGQTSATVSQSATTSYSLTPNTAPTITSIANQTTTRNAATSALSFTVGDAETAVTSLAITASSSNTTLVPLANIVITGTGASRSVVVTPALGQSGTATITITVSDGITTTSTTFTITVPPPNVLFIIADDFGLDASSLYNTSSGVSLAPTPNIASLASGGVKFTNAYAYPVCSPTRSALMTGRYGFRTGTGNVAGGGNNALQTSEFTLPEAFAANSSLNYQLKQFGKWHLGGGSQAPCTIGGWPNFAGSLQGEVSDYNSWTKVVTDGTGPGTSSTTSTTYATTDVVNDAVSFINTQTTAGKPWVAWVAFNAPHTPLHLPPTNLCPHYSSLSGSAADISANPLNYYNAMIEAMDTEIGRLLASVDLTKTDVIFIGDNGTPTATLQAPYPSNHGKDTLYEGGIRVPLIVRGPDVVSPGRSATVLTHVVDLYSTILGLAGINVATTVPVGTTLDSQSLVPALQNQSVTRSLVYDEEFDIAFPSLGGRSLRDSQYKLIRKKTGSDEFYDLTADPYESTNLYGSMNAAQQVAYNSLVSQLGNFNTVPTISTVAAQSTQPSTATGAIAFTIGDAEMSASLLTVTSSSSNTTLVPDANLVFGGSGASRTLTITPATGPTGTSTITLNVTDGMFTASTSFLLTVAVSGPPTITSITTNPASPTSTDAVSVSANVQPIGGRTLTSVQLAYDTGAQASSTVFTETMGTAAGAWTTATNLGTNNAWTVNFAQPQPNGPFTQTTAANHGVGNAYGLEMNRGTPNLTDNYITTTNAINAVGTWGYVEFYISTANLINSGGWAFQTSTDGATWTTRLSETTANNHAYALYHYDISAGERVNTLRLRFQFAGAGPANPASKISCDDIKVVTTNTPAPVNMTGSASGGVFTTASPIPAQATGTTVSYTITATDSAAAMTTSATNSYTVVAAVPVLAVTPTSTLSSAGATGSGVFTPSSLAYTLTNSGTGTMSWTASKTASWLTLSSTSGTLAAGANTTVTASINSASASALAAGSYNDTITFTNTTNGSGSTTRAASLAVNATTAPGTPTLATLGAFTQGKSKTVSWSAVPNATSYTLQVSAASNFNTVLTSQTVTGTSASFTNLTEGVTYFYRLLATNNIGSSGYSNVVSSTQDYTAPSVTITTPISGTSTATASIVVSGTAADATSTVANVTVNGVTATTSNNFATWTVTVPLGFGTNGITAVAYDGAGNVTTTTPVTVTLTTAQTYNPLVIPEVMTGTTFDLNLHQTSKQFLAGAATTTYAFNNMQFWGPTLIMNKGDFVQMNVTNNLLETTTTHWHGFHIPAIMDGGPRQTIPPGTTWSPSFKVDNNAGTYWYHPHLHEFTQDHLTHGGGGMIIIRDPIESALNLPRSYGVDDIPVVLTSRRFTSNQFVTANSAYGDQELTNGVLNAQVALPKQYVRLRILNAEIERNYNLGFSDNRTFYVIATDGGLVDAPIAVTRVVMGVGERIEILVDLTADAIGATLDLMSYNATASIPTALRQGYPGGEAATSGQFGSLLNNTDFRVLHINVGAATANPVITRPTTLTTNTLWTANDVTNNRTINITGGTPGTAFTFDNLAYSTNVINQTLNLGAVEKWTIVNNSPFSHSFHIHDVQFSILSRTGGTGAVANYETGWKDTVYVQQNSTVSFIAKFDAFASNTNPFMYHCHFLNHEDEGTMGQFIVVNNAVEDLAVASFTRTGDNSLISLDFKATPGTTYTLQYSPDMTTGSWVDIGSVTSDGTSANFTETDVARLGQARGFYRVAIPTVAP